MNESGFQDVTKNRAKAYSILFEEFAHNINFGELHPQAYEPVNYFLQSKGKRIRPLLLLLGCDAFCGNMEDALGPAYGIELFHNFTLIHDDIMDEAKIRRGRPTLHEQFGEGTAILAGDFLLILAYRYLSKVNPKILPSVLDTFNKTAIQIIEGQVMDAGFENTQHVKESEYLRMIECKTSVLLASSLKIGALIGNASVQDQEHLYQFGLNLGLAFQIKDDWLDVYGDHSLGKRIGGDIIRDKKTYLFIKALNSGNSKQREKLIQLVDEKDENSKIVETIEIYNEMNIGEETERYMNILYDNAIEQLDQVSGGHEVTDEIRNFAQLIYNRAY